MNIIDLYVNLITILYGKPFILDLLTTALLLVQYIY